MPVRPTLNTLAERSDGALELETLDNAWPARGTVRATHWTQRAWIYSRTVGPSGRGREDERRFQNPAEETVRAIDPPEGVLALLLGLWAEDGLERLVVVAMDAERRRGQRTRTSFFAPLATLRHAAREGYATHESESGERIAAFRPERFRRYLDELVVPASVPAGPQASMSEEPEPVDDELESFEGGHVEGTKRSRYSTRYERSWRNRERAIELHGVRCQVCDFDFGKTYGELGEGFIHVHHNKPVSESGEMVIDPAADLSVVCPNCHHMLHRPRERTLSVQELRHILNTERRDRSG